jgi:branched-chain amino acid transport system ATP-binding protein
MEAIRKTHHLGVTIVLVEHNMQIMDLCSRVVVVNFGQKIAEGSPSEIRDNEEVVRAYFGGGHVA